MEEIDSDEKTRIFSEILHNFVSHCDDLENEDDPSGDGFTREFRGLRELGTKMRENNTYPADEGRKPHNIKKNRYKDILPFDYTRVMLDEIPGVDGANYINANFIENPIGAEAYIASQGPLPATVNDFWRMLWKYKVKVIVMACKLVEIGKKKCEQYWPSEVGEKTAFGDVNVTMNREENMAENCTVRQLKMEKDGHSVQVNQFHYTGWPDHDIPDDIDVILEMIAGMRELRDRDADQSPIVIHCSAGCGRTGTICAIDYAWDLLKSGALKPDFSLYNIIKHMREQRQSMIQAPEQYKMAHLTVKRLFEEHLTLLEEHEYANFNFLGQEEDGNTESGSGIAAPKNESPSTERRPSAYKAQITQTIENYVNMNFPGPTLDDPIIAPTVASAAEKPHEPLISPGIKERAMVFSAQEDVPVVREVHRGNAVVPPKVEMSVPKKKVPATKPEIIGTKPAVPGMKPSTSNTAALQNSVSSADNKVGLNRSISTVNDGGKHKTVISIMHSAPQATTAPKENLPTKSKSLPHKSGTSTFYDTPNSVPHTADVKTDSFTMSAGVYSQVGQSSFFTSAKEPKEASQESQPENMYAVVNKQTNSSANSTTGKDLYAVVHKSGSGKLETPDADDYNPYDEVRVGTNGSLVGDTPPVPERGYLQPEPTPAEPEKGSTETSKRQIVKQKIKNLFPGSKSSGSTSNHISTDIPGFKTRIEKKPSGPRDPPSSWSKK